MGHCSKLHRYVKGGGPLDTISTKIGGVDTDPGKLLDAIVEEWSGIWGCGDPAERAAAAKERREAFSLAPIQQCIGACQQLDIWEYELLLEHGEWAI